MFLLFYGQDTYRLKQKIRELKAKFISASLGDTNLAVIDGQTATFDEIVRQTLALPFLAKSRLAVVENLLTLGKKEVQEKMTALLPKVPKSTVLVFTEEGAPDRRTALFKKLNQPKQAQEFKLLEMPELIRWIKKETESRGAAIEAAAAQKLAEFVGNDLWRMSNELDKLTAYSQRLTAKEVELLVKSQTQSNIFDLIDAVANKNQVKATRELHRLLESGEAALYLLSMIVYQFRNLLMVKDLIERSKQTLSSWDLAKKLGLHPFVAQKTLNQAGRYTFGELKNIYGRLLDFDLRIKTGKIEADTALDLLVVKLSV